VIKLDDGCSSETERQRNRVEVHSRRGGMEAAGRHGICHTCRLSAMNECSTGRQFLQRVQKRKERLLFFGAKLAEMIPYLFRFAAVTFDGIF
jgi:hypothetical protein